MSTLTMLDMVNRVHTKIAGGSCPVTSALKTEIKWALHLAHADIFKGVDYTWMRRQGYLTTVAATQEYTLPRDFSKIIEPSLEIPADNVVLRYIKTQHLDQYQPSRYRGTGRPSRYSIPDSHRATGQYRLLLYPTPDQAYSLTFRYFSLPDEIHSMEDAAYFDARFPDGYYDTLYHGALSNLVDYLDNLTVQKATLDYRNAKSALRRGNLIVKGDRHQKERHRYPSRAVWVGDNETPLDAPSDILSPY